MWQSSGAAVGSLSIRPVWHWPWPAPASWAGAIRFTCSLIHRKVSIRRPRSAERRHQHSRRVGDISHGFVYQRVPHITLKSIANNAEIDVIWERFKEEAGASAAGSSRRH